MSVVYRGLMTREGTMLLRVDKRGSFAIAPFRYERNGSALPWDWVGGFYQRWCIAYALLYDATGQQTELTSRLAAPFALQFVSNFPAERWELTRDDIRVWVVDQAARSIVGDWGT